ncbi:hypothetical protein Athai_31430 [Actinocatenispora thailandica]|uniref:EccD-like transmembrane domain-containing protein n=1 Tax=Actinocatenispora thailandica TaxID=227318 RepID=A0A7R7DPS4_9ACTN|nr:type VII secretion integral membrane protein EccD [Actinocatenispora thailandica]BCJ35640.1 hypothetical protein Athai_31430 [Actinocatenispora thailandica]
MSTTLSEELCRITVTGPDRRIDLAVPVTTTVAALLPLLVQHTVDPAQLRAAHGRPDAGWVLQRLGQSPFPPTGTPDSLDWLEGEELHLRRAEDPLPSLDYDDLADGVADAINRRSDRWRPAYRRILFLLLSLVATGALAAVLVGYGTTGQQVGVGIVVGVIYLAAALVCGRALRDGAFALLFGYGAAGFAAIAVAAGIAGDASRVTAGGTPLLAAAAAVIGVTVLLLTAERTFGPHIPLAGLVIPGFVGVVTAVTVLLWLGPGLTAPHAAALVTLALFAVVVLAPRMAVKLSGLRAPQLPKTSEDMSYDIEPDAAAHIDQRTGDADAYLTVGLLGGALVAPVLCHVVMRVGGWSGWMFVLLLSVSVLLRARTFLGVWQRGALVFFGVVGSLMVIVRLAATSGSTGRWLLLSLLFVLVLPLILSALRPWPRRMLPIWEYTARFLDVATAVAVLPVLAQVLGLYGWARGLFG